MRGSQLLLALLAVQLACICRSVSDSTRPHGAAAHNGTVIAASGSGIAAVLSNLRRAVGPPASSDGRLVDAAAALVQACRQHQSAAGVMLPPSLAAEALEALALAAASAVQPAHRGAVLQERGALLELLGRAGAAHDALATAAGLLQAHPLPPAAPVGGGYQAANASKPASSNQVASVQRWVVSRLLQLTRSLNDLGQEQLADSILAPLPATAIALTDPHLYVSAVAQLQALTDEQLAQLEACTALLEREEQQQERDQDRPQHVQQQQEQQDAPHAAKQREPPLVYERGARESTDCTAATDQRGTECPWMSGFSGSKAFHLFYALHRALHKRGRFPDAWRALQQAKRLQCPSPRYMAEQQAAVLEDLSILFPAAPHGGQKQAGSWRARALAAVTRLLQRAGRLLPLPARQPGAGASAGPQRPELRPIFIVGLPRSGTTVLEQILSSHPEVWGAGERTHLGATVERLLQDIAERGSVNSTRLQELREEYLARMRGLMPPERANATWLVDKNLDNAWHLGHIALMLPGACVLHAARHPADSALSSHQQAFLPDAIPWSFNLSHTAAHVAAHHRVMAHWRAALPGRVLDVHYSRLVEDMEGTMRAVLRHCGLSWHDAMRRFHDNPRFVYTASRLQVRKPIYTSSLGKWVAYKEGLAPLLLELREVILRYEREAGLPSSEAVLDELRRRAGQAPGAVMGEQPARKLGRPADDRRQRGVGDAAAEGAPARQRGDCATPAGDGDRCSSVAGTGSCGMEPS